MTEALFDLPPDAIVAEERGTLSAARRLTLRQRADIAAGRHPFAGGPIHTDARRRCGNCTHRQVVPYHGRSYPKCWVFGDGCVTHGPASDIRAWWPGCRAHEWGDPKLSPDAARSGPPS